MVVEFLAKNLAVAENIGTVKLRVKRRGDLSEQVTVRYETQDGIAKAPQDYIHVSGELVFKPLQEELEIEAG